MTSTLRDPSCIQRLMRATLAAAIACLVLVIFPYTQDAVTPVKYLILAWAALLLAAVWLLGGALAALRASRPSSLCWLLIAFVVVNAIAALASPYRMNSLNELRRIVLFALLFLLTSHCVRTPAHAWRLLWLLCGALTLASFYGFFQKAGVDPFPWAFRDVEEYRRLPATFGNPNLAAHALLMGVIAAAALSSRKGLSRWSRATAVFMTAVLFTHLVLTHSRAGVVALAGASALIIIAVFLRSRVTRPIRNVVLTCVVVSVLGVVSLAAVAGILQAHTGSPVPLDTSVLLRYNSGYGAARMILDRPGLGYGPGNYVIQNVPYWTSYEQEWFAVQRKVNEHVHNDLLETAVDAGFPALLLHLCLLAGGVVYALIDAARTRDFARRRLAYALAACFFAFGIDGLFGFNARVPVSGALFFLLLGVLEGTGMTAPPAYQSDWPRWKSLSLQTAVVLVAAIAAAMETQVFAARFLSQHASRLQAAGDSDAALTCLRKAESLVPWDWTLPHALSLAERARGNPGDALGHAQRALTLNPYYLMSYVSLANACIDLVEPHSASGRSGESQLHLDQAQHHAATALAYAPRLPEAHIALGRIWSFRALRFTGAAKKPRAAQAWRNAISHYRNALAVIDDASERSRTQRMLAVAFLNAGETKRAERSIRASVESDPAQRKNWDIFLDHARKAGQYDELIRSLHLALKRLKGRRTPDEQTIADLYVLLSTAHTEAGHDAEQVRAALESALDAAPHRLELWGSWMATIDAAQQTPALAQRIAGLRGQLGTQGQNLPPALAALDAAFQPDPAPLVEHIEQFAQACELRAAQTSPQQLAAEYAWAAQQLNKELAKHTLSEAGQARAAWSLGRVFARCQRWQEAETALSHVQRYLPPSVLPECLLMRAEALAQLGEAPEALGLARQAVDLAPERFDARWSLAKRLAETGRAAEARLEYKSLLAMPLEDEPIRRQLQDELDALTQHTQEGDVP